MSGGFSKDRLKRLRTVLTNHIEQSDVPGAVALVSRRGETHVEVVGRKSAGGGSIARDTIFRISSMTKPITAVAAMILVEECVLRLDEPIDRFLPELADRKVLKSLDGSLDEVEPARRAITIRDLLTFRMGFGIPMAPPNTFPIQAEIDRLQLGQGAPQPQKPPAPDEWARRLGTLPLMHQPGEQWAYNTGSDVLGVLIARASGQPFDVFLKERLFEPLGMKDTAFFAPKSKIDRLATGYGTNFGTGEVEIYDEAKGGQWSSPPAFPGGGAGLVSTVDDYFAFAQMLFNKGVYNGKRLLSRPSVELMTMDHMAPEQKTAPGFFPGWFDAVGWGFGVAVLNRAVDLAGSVGRYGWDGGLGTTWRNDLKEELITVLMTQRAWTSPNPPDICRDFWTTCYQAIDD